MIFIESTAEGRQGDFYESCRNAQAKRDAGRALSKMDFKFFFYPWWRDPKNVLDPRTVTVTDAARKYFRDLHRTQGITLTPGQKAWYVKKEEQNRDLMFREHPSTSEEAFQGATEGTFYGKLMIRARREGRIAERLPIEPGLPVDTTWDWGKNDETAIWFHQWHRRHGVHRWIHYYANHSWGIAHYANCLFEFRERTDCVFGTHYLPHDFGVSDATQRKGETREDFLNDLGIRNTLIVERVPNVMDGIEAVRQIIPVSEFSEEGCSEGILSLENYQREMDEKTESFKDTPRHDQASNGADAFRQLCQAWEPEVTYRRHKPRERNWRRT